MKRPAFTLVELLVVVTIIGILVSLTLLGVRYAAEAGREAATRSTIAKINGVVATAWDSYQTRRLPIAVKGVSVPYVDTDGDGIVDTPLWSPDRYRGLVPAKIWNARRDLLRLEMPDRFSDFLDPPLFLDAADCQRARQHYAASYNGAFARLRQGGLSDSEAIDRLNSYELSECLYLTVMHHGGNQIAWRSNERGDTDRDGLQEFLDGWGRPIIWLRWPAGWPGADEPPIAYDPGQFAGLRSLGPRPIIMSAGPDGIYDVNRGVEPDPAGGMMTYHYGLDPFGDLNPWTIDENIPPRRIGEPVDAAAPNGDSPNGDLDHHDNLSSYDLSSPP